MLSVPVSVRFVIRIRQKHHTLTKLLQHLRRLMLTVLQTASNAICITRHQADWPLLQTAAAMRVTAIHRHQETLSVLSSELRISGLLPDLKIIQAAVVRTLLLVIFLQLPSNLTAG